MRAVTATFRWALCCGLLLAFALPVRAQMTATYQVEAAEQAQRPTPPAAERNCTLSGTVLNSLTSEPMRRVFVQLTSPESRATLTDGHGTFSFEALPAGATRLSFRKPGYFSERGQPFGQARLKLGADSGPVTLKLAPAASMVGWVLTPEGEAIPGLSVSAVPAQKDSASGINAVQSVARTDQNGSFRLAQLPSGSYLLMVEGDTTPRPVQTPTAPAREVVFAQRYYPGVAERSAASVLELRPGQEVSANFALSAEPVHHVSGKVSESSGTLQLFRLTGDGHDLNFHATVANGRFETELPAGSYQAMLQASGKAASKISVGVAPLTVRGDDATAQITLLPPVKIPVRVVKESANGSVVVSTAEMEQGAVFVQLEPLQTLAWMMGAGWNPRGMALQDVLPGSYRLRVGCQPPWRIKSARSGGSDLLSGPLTVHPGAVPDPLEIILSDDTGGVRGTIVKLTGNPPEAWMVALIPKGLENISAADGFNSGTPNQPLVEIFNQSSFEFQGVPPGDYLAVAVDAAGIPDSDERGAFDAVERMLHLGTAFTVQPRGLTILNITPSEVP
jgi:hypothetical protein